MSKTITIKRTKPDKDGNFIIGGNKVHKSAYTHIIQSFLEKNPDDMPYKGLFLVSFEDDRRIAPMNIGKIIDITDDTITVDYTGSPMSQLLDELDTDKVEAGIVLKSHTTIPDDNSELIGFFLSECSIYEDFSIYNKIKIRYHRELFPDLKKIEINPKGDFIDLYSAEEVHIEKGEFKYINLGISIQLPKGYWAQLVMRSSTFSNYGIIQTNAFGVIDESYCGDNDIWKLPVYATRDAIIPKNAKICQFRIVKKSSEFELMEVDKLENEDRGGFGSTGK